jgi:hypothetical protein
MAAIVSSGHAADVSRGDDLVKKREGLPAFLRTS